MQAVEKTKPNGTEVGHNYISYKCIGHNFEKKKTKPNGTEVCEKEERLLS